MKECKPMDIYVLNRLNGISDIISAYRSSIWNVQYFGQGDFQLILDASAKNLDILKPGTYLVREEDVTSSGFKNVMVIQNDKLDYNIESGWLLTLTGKSLKSDLLKRRIVWSQTNLENYNVVTGIRDVITNNIINPSDNKRKINNFLLDSAQQIQDTFTTQLFGENIADWVEEICTSYELGWDVYIYNGKYYFNVYKGEERENVIFCSEYDNLLSSSYDYNLDIYQTTALIGGEGAGTNQIIESVGDNYQGLNRYETYVDGSSVSSNGEIITETTYRNMLKEYGKTQINQTAFTESFTGEIDYNGLFKLNQDFFLGDVVKIKNEKGITANSRIIEIIYATDENGTSIVPTFSNWEVNN